MKDRIAIRTLVIDDDEALCRRITTWLAAEAYDVVSFTDPSAGLRHAISAPCDVALVDLRLPETDGATVIASLCKASPQTRVVAMAAFPETDQVVQAVRAGARDLLAKPIQPPSLLAAIDRQLAEMGLAARTEDGFNRRLGARLREMRIASQRTQQDVAHAAEITAAQLSQIELGKTATSTWTLARLCGSLKINLSTLFSGI